MNSHDDAPYEPTTTHAEWGAGDPHLTVTRDGDRFTFALTADAVRIGSAEGNELTPQPSRPDYSEGVRRESDEARAPEGRGVEVKNG
ncbi:hypothetical protein KEC56_05125 [Microbacterium sp. YMB-B2]|uniref:Uncharacterized protein n=1 Tax=Microbacterium tenebrionis TaxID=2830665 RepID=A0A9X1S0N2_9MICO|nr:hypothetical protein [Microbacterium tenebrionis]MCC2028903.1 hypothetical protein [Microbacterium tenebrionis]